MQRRPWLLRPAALTVLVVLAMPLFSMRLAFSDAGNDPTALTTRQAYDLLATGSAPDSTDHSSSRPTSRPGHRAGRAAVSALDNRWRRPRRGLGGTAAVFNAAGDAAVIVVYPTTSPQAAQTASLVRHLRGVVIPPAVHGTGVTVLVGGVTRPASTPRTTCRTGCRW